MRVLTTIMLATLTGTAAAIPLSRPADARPAIVASLQQENEAVEPVAFDKAVVEARANTAADVKKHDDNHLKISNNNCGRGCHASLNSYHSQASKDSKASKASKASQASKNSKSSKKSKSGRDLANVEGVEGIEMEERDLENVDEIEA